MKQNFAPYRCSFSLSSEILTVAASIAFKSGRLSVIGEKKANREDAIEAVKYTLLSEGVALSASELRGLRQGEDLVKHPEALRLLKLYERLPNLNFYDPALLSEIEKAIFPHGVPNRMGKTAEGLSYPLPQKAKIEPLIKWLYAYASSREKNSPLIVACLFYFEILAIAPYSRYNGIVARFLFKGFLSTYCSSLSATSLEKALFLNKEKLEAAYKECIEKEDAAPFFSALLSLVDSSASSLLRGNLRKPRVATPLVERMLSLMVPGRRYSATELLVLLGLKSRLGLQKNYLRPALEAKLIAMSNPLVPTDRNQRYYKLED